MACFAGINVSQGSVAMQHKNLQNYGHESEAPFFAHPVLWSYGAAIGDLFLLVIQWRTDLQHDTLATRRFSV